MIEEKGEWLDIPNKFGVWKPEKPGETLIGTYLKKFPDSYMGRKGWKYCFESEHPEAVEGKISVYGTVGIDNALKDKYINKKLKIIYKGEKKGGDPKKKAFKMFNIKAFLAPSDPLYAELKRLNSDTQDEPTIKEPPADFLGDFDAARLIDILTDDLIDDGVEPSIDAILDLAKKYHLNKNEDFKDPKILGRIEKQLHLKG